MIRPLFSVPDSLSISDKCILIGIANYLKVNEGYNDEGYNDEGYNDEGYNDEDSIELASAVLCVACRQCHGSRLGR
jgi:hypothetical protein